MRHSKNLTLFGENNMPFLAPAVAAVTAFASTAIGSFIIRLGVSFIIGRIQQKRMESKMRKMQENAKAAASAVLINSSSNSDPIPIIYGRTRVGGIRSFVETTDNAGDESKTEYLNMILVMAEGEVRTPKKVFFDDTVVWDADVNGTVSGNQLQNFMAKGSDDDPSNIFYDSLSEAGTKIFFHNGSDDQTYNTTFSTSVGSDLWGSTHRNRGLVYAAIILKANADVYKGGLPLVTFEMEGKRIQNVANITSGDTTITHYTAGRDINPVDVLYDYLTNPRYGKGLDHTSVDRSDPESGYSAGLHIDLDSFQTARTLVNGVFKINGVMSTAEQVYNNVGEILESMNGILIFQNGKYKLKIKNQNETSVKTFGYDEIVTPVALQLPGKDAKFNKVNAYFRNRDNDSAKASNGRSDAFNEDIVVSENSTYLSEDNNQVLEFEIRLDLVDEESLVQDIAEYQMDETRYGSVIEFETAHTALKVECGDIIKMQLDDFGWTVGNEKEFRVVQMSITPENTIRFTAQEYESSIQLL